MFVGCVENGGKWWKIEDRYLVELLVCMTYFIGLWKGKWWKIEESSGRMFVGCGKWCKMEGRSLVQQVVCIMYIMLYAISKVVHIDTLYRLVEQSNIYPQLFIIFPHFPHHIKSLPTFLHFPSLYPIPLNPQHKYIIHTSSSTKHISSTFHYFPHSQNRVEWGHYTY